jgi:hypothetical protein
LAIGAEWGASSRAQVGQAEAAGYAGPGRLGVGLSGIGRGRRRGRGYELMDGRIKLRPSVNSVPTCPMAHISTQHL